MKRFISVFSLAAIILYAPPAFAATMLRGPDNVDIINIMGYFKDNNILNVTLIYIDRDEDRMVEWESGSVTCHWNLYVYFEKEEKSTLIKSGTKYLNRYDQDFFIDIPISYLKSGKWGLLECNFFIGVKKLFASDIFPLQ